MRNISAVTLLSFKRINMATSKKKSANDPCWDGYEKIGMKKKGGKAVPNCVPVKKAGKKAVAKKAVTKKTSPKKAAAKKASPKKAATKKAATKKASPKKAAANKK
jgi:hypothetical protein